MFNSTSITNDNTATATMNTSNKRPALWCRTLSPLTSPGVTGRPFWSDQYWGACPALFLLSYTLFMQVLPTGCQQGGENTASILPLLQIIPHYVKDFIPHTYCFDPTSNLVSWFLPEKTKSHGCFPQNCLNIVLVWDLGEMFKNFDCLADQLSNGHEIPDKLGQESPDKFGFLRKVSS